MKILDMPPLIIGSKISPLPIIQGGMGVGISLSGLAAAVANEGGIGVIAANAIGMIEPDYFDNGIESNIRALRNEIRKARAESSGIIGVNLMVAANDFQRLINVILEEKPDLVFMGAGLPIKGVPVEKFRENDISIVPIVSSARAANLIFKSWQKKFDDIPDAVVVEGPLAGGHLGFKEEEISNSNNCLEVIIPDVIETIAKYEAIFDRKIPVIAAGGIHDGGDIYKYLKLGASGIQMGSRFVATTECDADIKFKEEFVKAKEEDIIIIQSPLGMPGRAIYNSFIENINSKDSCSIKCPWKCLESCNSKESGYCISIALNNARKGDLENGYAFAGANSYKVSEIVSVHNMINSLQVEYVEAVYNVFESVKYDCDQIIDKFIRLKQEYASVLEVLSAKCGDKVKTIIEKCNTCATESINEGDMHYARIVNTFQTKLEGLKEEYLESLNSMGRLQAMQE